MPTGLDRAASTQASAAVGVTRTGAGGPGSGPNGTFLSGGDLGIGALLASLIRGARGLVAMFTLLYVIRLHLHLFDVINDRLRAKLSRHVHKVLLRQLLVVGKVWIFCHTQGVTHHSHAIFERLSYHLYIILMISHYRSASKGSSQTNLCGLYRGPRSPEGYTTATEIAQS